ncbi:MAG: dihydroorotase [Flavobacteriales bacterium]|nr:dihydroorotase [Flavobacteriales bacterium]
MGILLKSVKVVDPSGPHHGKVRDVLIGKGVIEKIAKDLPVAGHKLVDLKGALVSPGWVDMCARFGDPGFEYREDLVSGTEAAAAGGFTHVVVMPGNDPVTDNKASIEYLYRRSAGLSAALLPLGTISRQMAGKQLADMYDMHDAGAVGFSDDHQNVSTELMMRALDYARNFDGLIYSFPHDVASSRGGQMHEGPVSVSLGLKGIPSMSEELRLHRDIELLRYTGGRMHVTALSTARGVEMVRKAKKDKLNITASVAAHQLLLTEEALLGFDQQAKVLPPFRSSRDAEALIRGVADGTIDTICSDHTPLEIELKDCEFDHATPGISSIQVVWNVLCSAVSDKIETEVLVQRLYGNSRNILGLPALHIDTGAPAHLTLFSDKGTTEVQRNTWKSKSFNSPFLGKSLRGIVYGTVYSDGTLSRLSLRSTKVDRKGLLTGQ